MPRVVVEMLGGPDDGRQRSIPAERPADLPELLPALDGREQYRAAGVPRGRARQHYRWEPEQPARRRPPCTEHNPPLPGCPGYQPTATTT